MQLIKVDIVFSDIEECLFEKKTKIQIILRMNETM